MMGCVTGDGYFSGMDSRQELTFHIYFSQSVYRLHRNLEALLEYPANGLMTRRLGLRIEKWFECL